MWKLQFSIFVLCICNCKLEMTTINDFVLKKLLYKIKKKWYLVFFIYNVIFDWLATLQIDQQTMSKQRIYLDIAGTLQGNVKATFQITPNYDLLATLGNDKNATLWRSRCCTYWVLDPPLPYLFLRFNRYFKNKKF